MTVSFGLCRNAFKIFTKRTIVRLHQFIIPGQPQHVIQRGINRNKMVLNCISMPISESLGTLKFLATLQDLNIPLEFSSRSVLRRPDLIGSILFEHPENNAAELSSERTYCLVMRFPFRTLFLIVTLRFRHALAMPVYTGHHRAFSAFVDVFRRL